MKKSIVIISTLFVATTSGPGFGQGRLNTMRMSCGAAATIVRNAGAVVLGSGPHIYDRYVASRAFCNRDEQTEPRWIPSGDNPQCFIGYVCERKYGDPASR